MEASAKMRLSRLRQAVRENRVSFPSPVPKFAHQYRADVQWRLAELYFVRGWSFCQLVWCGRNSNDYHVRVVFTMEEQRQCVWRDPWC